MRYGKKEYGKKESILPYALISILAIIIAVGFQLQCDSWARRKGGHGILSRDLGCVCIYPDGKMEAR